MLFQVVGLDELHATLTADVRSDVFVFHHVVLKLTRVLESLLALRTPAETKGNVFMEPKRESGNVKAPAQRFGEVNLFAGELK